MSEEDEDYNEEKFGILKDGNRYVCWYDYYEAYYYVLSTSGILTMFNYAFSNSNTHLNGESIWTIIKAVLPYKKHPSSFLSSSSYYYEFNSPI